MRVIQQALISAVAILAIAASPYSAFAIALPSSANALRVVALSKTPAPIAGAYFDGLAVGTLNGQDQTAFLANLQLGDGGVNADNDRSMLSEIGGSLRLVAREGAAAASTPTGSTFDLLGEPYLDAAGRVAFIASLNENAGVTANSDTGIWSEATGSLSLVAREGGHAPGTPAGASFGDFNPFGRLRMNSAGQVAFRASLIPGAGGVTSDNDSGVWAERLGSLQLVVRAGDPAPGVPSGGLFTDFNEAEFNDLGQTAFRGHLQIGPGGVTVFDQDGIWSEGGGALHLVARRGDHAPGAPAGANFGGFFLPALNNHGQTAFSGVLTGDGITSSNNFGIWSEGSGALQLVARKGNPAPGAPLGEPFAELGSPVIDDVGQTAFYAAIQRNSGGTSPGDDRGVWSDAGGSLHLVAIEGGPAPGTTTTFYNFFNNLAVNSAGQLAFLAELRDGSGNGIWATNRAGELRLIVRAGDALDVDNGPGVDLRTVSALFFESNSGGFTGQRSSLNVRGQLAFTATFTDGSDGNFVTSLVAVPEPSHCLLACFAAALPIMLEPRQRR
jgi:hypothetical protein